MKEIQSVVGLEIARAEFETKHFAGAVNFLDDSHLVKGKHDGS